MSKLLCGLAIWLLVAALTFVFLVMTNGDKLLSGVFIGIAIVYIAKWRRHKRA